jgi:succinyl-diaminopimelate desuccinylase
MVLCQLLAQLRDKNGRITIPGFYDDVIPLTPYERKQLARLPHDEASYRNFLGVPELFGERGYTSTEQRCARPTLEINGLTSGYQGEGSKTIIPAWARAKITCRLVPSQTPQKIGKLVINHLKRICPPTVRLAVRSGHGGDPYLVSPTSPHAQAALRALKSSFDREPVLMREGGSIPIVNQFKKYLGAETLLLGLALPDDNPHSPNEKFDLECFAKGMRLGACLWPELAKV